MKRIENDILLQHGHVLGLLLTLAGVSVQQYYLLNVGGIPIYVLGVGVAAIAIGAILSYNVVELKPGLAKYALLSVYITFLSLIIMPFIRFNALSGNDVLYEFRAAEITSAQGWNTPFSTQDWYIRNFDYLSCLSITILPTVFSRITGIDLFFIFKYCLSAIVSLTPILVYVNVKEAFGRPDLAVLSAIVFSQLYFVFSSISIGGFRQPIALLFLLCALFTIIKIAKGYHNKAYLLLLCIFIIGIVFSHYTVAYYSLAIFFSLMCVAFLVSKNRKVRLLLHASIQKAPRRSALLTRFVFVFLLISSFAWFAFVASSPFFIHLGILTTILNPRTGPTLGVGITTFVVNSPLEPWVGNWFRFEMVLAFVGFLYLLFRKKDFGALTWFMCGGVTLVLFLSTFIPYGYELFGEFTRFYIMGYSFLCVFVALVLIGVDRKLKHVPLVLFLLLNLPMNMLLPVNQRYVLYHSEESISPTVAISQNYLTEAEFAASLWIRNFVPAGQAISTDQRGSVNMYYANRPIYAWNTESLDYLSDSRYLFLDSFTVKFGLWLQNYLYVTVKWSDMSSTISNNDVIYSDGNMLLMKR
jgi:uncharacterized membrane protein